MVGILVHGNNHFILSGPRPTQAEALDLARNWSLVQIGGAKSQKFDRWEIRNKEFRENLEWAVIVPGDRETSAGVTELLAELGARGVAIVKYGVDLLDDGPVWKDEDHPELAVSTAEWVRQLRQESEARLKHPQEDGDE